MKGHLSVWKNDRPCRRAASNNSRSSVRSYEVGVRIVVAVVEPGGMHSKDSRPSGTGFTEGRD